MIRYFSQVAICLNRNVDTLFWVLHSLNNYSWFTHLVMHPRRGSHYELQIHFLRYENSNVILNADSYLS